VPRILQIIYDPVRGSVRHELLTQAGFDVMTAMDNLEARELCKRNEFAAVIVGYGSPLPDRKLMVEWLRENCRGVPIISLYSEKFMPVREADYRIDGANPKAVVNTLRSVVPE
jgi:DNA-binding response OmpR family regulator